MDFSSSRSDHVCTVTYSLEVVLVRLCDYSIYSEL